MKFDWCKDTGKWNVWDIETNTLLAKADSVTFWVPSTLISTDGGRHGYLVAAGRLEIDDKNHATIRRER